MKKANISPKKNKDEQIIQLTDREQAEEVLKLAKEQQRVKENDPNYTAVIIRGDKKESRLHWIKTDKTNKEIGL